MPTSSGVGVGRPLGGSTNPLLVERPERPPKRGSFLCLTLGIKAITNKTATRA